MPDSASNNQKNSRSLIIFAKKPVPGSVKTRLSPPLTVEEAAELYSCMLKDTLEMAAGLDGITPVIYFQDDPGAAEYFSALAPEIESLPQVGADLGERMKSAFSGRFERGFRKVAIIGSDSPDLPAEYVVGAFKLLADEGGDLVLGPAEDGGYYLMGLKMIRDGLFTGIPWSSGEVFAATVKRAKEVCLGISFLGKWHDIDSAVDLERRELLDPNSPAARTRSFIISIRQPDIPHSPDS
jgi:rSAM/selenodomain-associated transferase 1